VESPLLFILEDDRQLREVLLRTLCAEGFDAHGLATAHELMQRVADERPDALVLDIGLPDADGRDVCQSLRAQGIEVPILFLTARDALTDRLAGFHAGGDDYVTKPFDIEEIVARLEVLLRRAASESADAAHGLKLDPAARTVSTDASRVALTPTEFRLLAALAANEGKACTRMELTRAAWPYGAIVHDNTLDVYVARLRRKLRAIPDAPSIVTVHGTGYRLE
jgi:two-component system response regulator MprA